MLPDLDMAPFEQKEIVIKTVKRFEVYRCRKH